MCSQLGYLNKSLSLYPLLSINDKFTLPVSIYTYLYSNVNIRTHNIMSSLPVFHPLLYPLPVYGAVLDSYFGYCFFSNFGSIVSSFSGPIFNQANLKLLSWVINSSYINSFDTEI